MPLGYEHRVFLLILMPEEVWSGAVIESAETFTQNVPQRSVTCSVTSGLLWFLIDSTLQSSQTGFLQQRHPVTIPHSNSASLLK